MVNNIRGSFRAGQRSCIQRKVTPLASSQLHRCSFFARMIRIARSTALASSAFRVRFAIGWSITIPPKNEGYRERVFFSFRFLVVFLAVSSRLWRRGSFVFEFHSSQKTFLPHFQWQRCMQRGSNHLHSDLGRDIHTFSKYRHLYIRQLSRFGISNIKGDERTL